MTRGGARLMAAIIISAIGTLATLENPTAADAAQSVAGRQVEQPAAAITNVVAHEPPISIAFVGPARFAGVTSTVDGSVITVRKWTGTIVAVAWHADRSRLVNDVPYARMMDGPLAGLWVKVNRPLTRARGMAPSPPPCRYDDILTSRRSYSRHAVTLLDTTYKVGPTYVPPDLRDTGSYGLNSGYRVRAVAGSDLAALARGARAAGAPIKVVSAYRSYAQQKATFDYWVSVAGYEQALLTSARAGHSEHQLGTTLDLTSKGGAAPWEYADWASTAAGAWMKRHAWKYGFVMTYPRGATAVSCYSYEPWHYRYVGRPIASALRASGMTLREAIWAAYGP